MVPKDRIELSSDPYQGPVLPLNYIGKISGVHDWNRTNDLQLRRLLLYPAELRGQILLQEIKEKEGQNISSKSYF